MNRMNLVIEGAYQPYPGIMFPLENTLHDDSTDHLLIILIKCLFLLTLVSHFTIYCLQHFVQTKVIITASVPLSLWVNCTFISFARPDVAVDREVEGDLILGDMGYGIPFKPGTFDGVIR